MHYSTILAQIDLLLGRRALCRATAAYSHWTFPLSICLSVQCMVVKRLIRYGCGLDDWFDGFRGEHLVHGKE